MNITVECVCFSFLPELRLLLAFLLSRDVSKINILLLDGRGVAEQSTGQEAKVTHFISAIWRHPVSIPTVNLHNTRSLNGWPCSVAIFCILQAKIYALFTICTYTPCTSPTITHTRTIKHARSFDVCAETSVSCPD